MISYHKMKKEDCMQVGELFSTCFRHPWSQNAVDQMTEQKGYLSYVAQTQGHIVGYAGLLAAADEADIVNVAVDPKFRRQGIADGLLERLLKEAQTSGIRKIFLEVRDSNEAAIHLYAGKTFAEIGRRKNYYDNPKEDARIMMWERG